MAEPLTLPGFVNAHSHAFQRALRGRSEGGDFWAWRDVMLAEAERQTPELVRREYVEVYRELRDAGFTAVGEFHYLGFDEALAAAEDALSAALGREVRVRPRADRCRVELEVDSPAEAIELAERLLADRGKGARAAA